MLLGFLGTSVIHLSKGIMKKGSKKRSTLFFLGVLLNFTNPLWVILANRFAPTVYYTSMYGLGLVTLLIYSHFVLGEKLSRTQFLGAAFILIGTMVLGLSRLITPFPSLFEAQRETILAFAFGWALLAPLALVLSKGLSLPWQEMIFGLAGGGFAALDAVLKGLAQVSEKGGNFLPQNGENWIIFLLSFLGAGAAFLIIQWSFHRHCRVSFMSSAYNVSYVSLPLVILFFSLSQGKPGWEGVITLIFLALGSFLFQKSSPVINPLPVVKEAENG